MPLIFDVLTIRIKYFRKKNLSMSIIGKVVGGGVLIMVLFIGGFMLLLRGCLSKYDERSALLPVLYFEKDTSAILFSVVTYGEAVSYESRGGFVRKTLNINYYIQQNDAKTAVKRVQKKIKHHDDIKQYPIEAIGAAHEKAWIFMGELVAFDPFTLELVADIKILEQKNPSLAGKFPAEGRYYKFNEANKNIFITASDGSKWELNTATLIASASNDGEEQTQLQYQLAVIESLYKKNNHLQDSLYKTHMIGPSKQYRAKEISFTRVNLMQNEFYQKRNLLYKERDSLQNVKTALQRKEQNERQLKSAVQNLARSNVDFSQMCTNQDTIDGKWYGLYSKAEFNKLYERVQIQRAYDETARRELISSSYNALPYGDYMIAKKNSQFEGNGQFFLQGGMLLDKSNALPIHMHEPPGYLVVFKDRIGNDGKILLASVTLEGRVLWNMETGLKSWSDWTFTGKRLFITGTDNKELSSGQSNVLWSIDLLTGKAAKYDYFDDKK